MKWIIRFVLFLLLLAFAVAQFLPIGKGRTNPPVLAEPKWDSPSTRALFFKACADCHSNETVWPWYSRIAPISWKIQSHVASGRRHLNVSEWGRKRNETDELAKQINEELMPLPSYLLMHANARLTRAEREQLLRGLNASFGIKDDPGKEKDKEEEEK